MKKNSCYETSLYLSTIDRVMKPVCQCVWYWEKKSKEKPLRKFGIIQTFDLFSQQLCGILGKEKQEYEKNDQN